MIKIFKSISNNSFKWILTASFIELLSFIAQFSVIVFSLNESIFNNNLSVLIRIIVIVLSLILIYSLDIFFLKFLHRFKSKILNSFFDSFFSSSPQFFDKKSIASTLKSTQANMTRIESIIPSVVSIISSFLILLILSVWVFFYFKLSFYYSLTPIVFIVIYRIRKRKMIQLSLLGNKLIDTYEILTRNITNFLSNYSMIIVNGRRDSYLDKFNTYLHLHVENQYVFFKKQITNRHIFLLLTVFFVIAVKKLNIDKNDILILSAMVFRILPILQQLVANINSVIYNFSGLDFLTPDSKLAFEIKYNSTINNADAAIDIVKLNFSYDEKKVIDDFNYTFLKGNKYLIRGVSGRGKTTLVKLILGLYTPESGKIVYSFNNTAPKIYYCGQTPFLEDSSIFSLLNKNSFNKEEILNILQKLNFSSSDNINLDELIGEGGKSLSGGQRQKLSILQAIYSGAQIIILDEPTSGMDEDSIRVFHDLINMVISSEQILIIVSHDDTRRFNNYQILTL